MSHSVAWCHLQLCKTLSISCNFLLNHRRRGVDSAKKAKEFLGLKDGKVTRPTCGHAGSPIRACARRRRPSNSRHYSTIGIRRRSANGIIKKRLNNFCLKPFLPKRLCLACSHRRFRENTPKFDCLGGETRDAIIICSFEGISTKSPVKT